VVVLVPIAFCVPAVLVLIPPPMALTPATLTDLAQFTTLVICAPAVTPMLLDCIVEFMFRMSYPTLTSVEVFCMKARHCDAKHNRQQNGYGKNRFSDSVHRLPPILVGARRIFDAGK
jgi:hypothetical protein